MSIHSIKKCSSVPIFPKIRIVPLIMLLVLLREMRLSFYILHIISVNPHASYLDNYMTKEYWDKLKVTMQEDLDKKYNDQYLSQIKDKTKVKIVTKSGREDKEILKFARKENIDIIVIGTHGRTGIEHVFIGSVAEKIVRRSPIPVFIIPCKKKSGFDSSR